MSRPGDLYVPGDAHAVRDLIAAYPLAWVVSHDGDETLSTPLPLLAETDNGAGTGAEGADGRIVSLLGHFARGNPQVAALMRRPRATFLFQGPHGYVSPRIVSQPAWGPTWNYATVRFTGEVAFLPDETEHAIDALTAHMEASAEHPWHVAQMGERYHVLKRHVVAFRAFVGPPRARFKLGQDETEASFAEIVERHPDRDLAAWMKRNRS